MLSNASDRAWETDDMATTAASSCAGLISNYVYVWWLLWSGCEVREGAAQGSRREDQAVGAVVQREFGVSSGCQQGWLRVRAEKRHGTRATRTNSSVVKRATGERDDGIEGEEGVW